MLGKTIAQYIIGIALTIIGWIEIARLWYYYIEGRESIHYTHHFRLWLWHQLGHDDEAKAFQEQLRDNWWQHHGLMSFFMSMAFPIGLLLLLRQIRLG